MREKKLFDRQINKHPKCTQPTPTHLPRPHVVVVTSACGARSYNCSLVLLLLSPNSHATQLLLAVPLLLVLLPPSLPPSTDACLPWIIFDDEGNPLPMRHSGDGTVRSRMAQLPPKTPNAATNWHASVHQNNFCMGTADSWVDEFLDFSAAKRAAHRRSANDSIAFLEAPVETVGGGGGHEFGRLDDDQLMSMFSDEAPHSSSDAVPIDSSNPPLQTSDDDHPDGEKIEEKQQQLYEAASLSQIGRRAEAKLAAASEQIVDPKRVKRTMVAAHQEALKKEIERLRQVYYQQSLEKMADGTTTTSSLRGEELRSSCSAATGCAPTT
ncbi:hypothetical protein GW17_00030929 [Ensete ventricosum]|nr:hypothetical protein GW17_00030929 [Ensete ventricosum]